MAGRSRVPDPPARTQYGPNAGLRGGLIRPAGAAISSTAEATFRAKSRKLASGNDLGPNREFLRLAAGKIGRADHESGGGGTP